MNGKPGIEYILEECIDAGIKEVVFIISSKKLMIKKYFYKDKFYKEIISKKTIKELRMNIKFLNIKNDKICFFRISRLAPQMLSIKQKNSLKINIFLCYYQMI